MTNLQSGKSLQKGFSLVELLIAGTILVVAIVAITVVISRGSGMSQQDMIRRRVYQELETVLEMPMFGANQYQQLLDFIGTGSTSATRILDTVTIVSVANIQAQRRVQLQQQLYIYGTVQIPGIYVTAQIFDYSNNQILGSLSTVVTKIK
jgi:Tfp pilus assembly protein PilV